MLRAQPSNLLLLFPGEEDDDDNHIENNAEYVDNDYGELAMTMVIRIMTMRLNLVTQVHGEWMATVGVRRVRILVIVKMIKPGFYFTSRSFLKHEEIGRNEAVKSQVQQTNLDIWRHGLARGKTCVS